MSFFVRKKQPGPIKPTANPYPSRFQKWRKRLGVTFLFLILIGGSFRFYSPFYAFFKQELFEVTALLQGVVVQPFQETRSLLKDTHTFIHLREEYDRLKMENESLKWQVHSLTPLLHENKTLKQLIKTPDFEAHGQLTARILSSPYDGLHHFFLVAAGRNHGIEKNQAVIVSEGIMGRVEKVGRNVARILLLNDSNSRIPVMTSLSEQKAILAGEGGDLPTLVYVGDVRKLQEGEGIVTSGLGGVFPPGLPVGIIDKIENGKVSIRPYVPFDRIEWVHILKSNFKDEIQEIDQIDQIKEEE